MVAGNVVSFSGPNGGRAIVLPADARALALAGQVAVALGSVRRHFDASDAELVAAALGGALAVIARRRGASGQAAGRLLLAELRKSIDDGADIAGAASVDLPSWIGS